MKKEIRDLLKQFRYFEIFDDCGYIDLNNDYIPLKKGDIIKVYNRQLENFVFCILDGILSSIGYNGFADSSDCKLVKYPEDKPLNIVEYLNMQPSFQLQETTEVGASISKDNFVYLTPELLDRLLNDRKNSIKFMNGESENVSEYNKRQILNFDGQLEYLGDSLKMLTVDATELKSSKVEREESEIQENYPETLAQIISKIKPGVYSTQSSFLPLVFFLEKGETIDLSKPEFAILALNQNFMKALARSTEITDPKKKYRIYKREQKDFLPNTNTRYYKLKKGIDAHLLIDYYSRELIDSSILQDIGHNFEPTRVKGEIELVEGYSEENPVIKVTYTNPAIYGIVDKELKKISKRLSRKEAIAMHSQEVSIREKKSEERKAQEAARKGKDYFRTKMMADLASTYVREQTLTDEFMHEAWEYYRQNQKQYYNVDKILNSDSDMEFEYDLSIEAFYMMHLIRTDKKDNRAIDASYQEKLQEERVTLANTLDNVLRKNNTGR